MKMLTALNTLGTLAAASGPQVQATRMTTCSNQFTYENFIDPHRDFRASPRYILSDITDEASVPFVINDLVDPANYPPLNPDSGDYQQKLKDKRHGEVDPLASLNFRSYNNRYLQKDVPTGHDPRNYYFRDRKGNTLAKDDAFGTLAWMEAPTWGGIMNPPGTSHKIKFTFADTASDTDYCQMTKESYTLYYNVGMYGNPIYSFVGIIAGNKRDASTNSSLNYKSMHYRNDKGTFESIYVPMIFNHRISFTDFHLTAKDRGLKIINPYMAVGQNGHDGVHGDYTYDYLDGFNWNLIHHKEPVRAPEGQRMFYHIAYELAMHMYQALNIV